MRVAFPGWGWLGWSLAMLALIVTGSGTALALALRTNAVAVLDNADWLLRGGGNAVLAASESYGPDPAQKLEMFVPRGTHGPLPVIVFIHGGSWASGNPQDYRFVARALAPQGYAVVLAGYRLYPQVRYPGMLEDGALALRWVADHAAGHGGDPSRVVVMGHSAGAYNALTLALDRRWLAARGLSANALRGAVGVSGPYDFYPFDTPAAVHSFGQAPDPRDTQPVAHARADAPPLLVVTGDADTVVKPRNSIALARAMTAAGAPLHAILLKGASHEDTIKMFARPFDRDRRVLDAILPFLARVTAPAAFPAPASGAVQAMAR